MELNHWKRLLCGLLSAALLLTAPVPAGASPDDRPPADGQDFDAFAQAAVELLAEHPADPDGAQLLGAGLADYATARLIVKAPGELDALGALSTVSGYNDLHVLQYADPATAAEAAAQYEAMDGVVYVQPDYLYEVDGDSQTPVDFPNYAPDATDDNRFLSWGYQTGHMNMGAFHDALSAEELQRQVVVAVLDTGADVDHPFLQGHVLTDHARSFINSDPKDVTDLDGHGTHVSGTVVDGTTDNVKILPVQVLGPYGGTTLSCYLGVLYTHAEGTPKVDVINMSYGGYGSKDYLEAESIQSALDSGITVVCSAGNENFNAVHYSPANCEGVISVAAVDQAHRRAGFSNYGDVIALSAPGVEIPSSCSPESGENSFDGEVTVPGYPGSKFALMKGTSQASPHVAAAAAMLRTLHPEYTPGQVKLRLTQAATISTRFWQDETGWQDGIAVPSMIDMEQLLDQPVSSLTLSRPKATLCPGQSFPLSAVSSQGKPLTWTVRDADGQETQAVTLENGLVTCHALSSPVTLTASDGDTAASCTVYTTPLEVHFPHQEPILYPGEYVSWPFTTNCDPAPEITWTLSEGAADSLNLYAFETADRGEENDERLPALPDGRTAVSREGLVFSVAPQPAADSFTLLAQVKNSGAAPLEIPVTICKSFDPARTEYEIRTPQDLEKLSRITQLFTGEHQDLTGVTLRLMDDLDFTGRAPFIALQSFNGTFLGNGHTIRGIVPDDSKTTGGILFDFLNGDARVSDLHIDASFDQFDSNYDHFGGIAGVNFGFLSDCSLSGELRVNVSENLGGIVGVNLGVLMDCENHASLTTPVSKSKAPNLGGIAGQLQGENRRTDGTEFYSPEILGCANYGKLHFDGWSSMGVGGIVGFIELDAWYGEDESLPELPPYDHPLQVSNCANHAQILADQIDNVGGIAGHVYFHCRPREVSLFSCANYGDVVGRDVVGGILGWSDLASVADARNSGSITGRDNVGGILGGGSNTQVCSSANSGSVVCRENGGGIMGHAMGACILTSDSNSGPVKAFSNAGGIAGRAFFTDILNCSNYGGVAGRDENGCDVSGGIVGRLRLFDYDEAGQPFTKPEWTALLCNNLNAAALQPGNSNGGICGWADYTPGLSIVNCVDPSSSFQLVSYLRDASGRVAPENASAVSHCYTTCPVNAFPGVRLLDNWGEAATADGLTVGGEPLLPLLNNWVLAQYDACDADWYDEQRLSFWTPDTSSPDFPALRAGLTVNDGENLFLLPYGPEHAWRMLTAARYDSGRMTAVECQGNYAGLPQMIYLTGEGVTGEELKVFTTRAFDDWQAGAPLAPAADQTQLIPLSI